MIWERNNQLNQPSDYYYSNTITSVAMGSSEKQKTTLQAKNFCVHFNFRHLLLALRMNL